MVRTSGSRDDKHGNTMMVEAPIASLPSLYPSLLQAAPDGLSTEDFEAECIQCGIRLSGAELVHLGDPNDDAPATPKLQRVQLGYCARSTCECRFYRVIVRAETDAVATALSGLVFAFPSLPFTTSRARLSGRSGFVALLSCALTIILFVAHHWYYGQRIPLLQKRHYYQANPESVSPVEFAY